MNRLLSIYLIDIMEEVISEEPYTIFFTATESEDFEEEELPDDQLSDEVLY